MRIGFFVLSSLIAVVAPTLARAELSLDGSQIQVNTFTTGDQGDAGADVAVASDGSFVAVWGSEGQDGDSDGIFGQRFGADGSKLGPEFQINTHTPDQQAEPSVDIASSDNSFVVVWATLLQDGDDYGIFARRYTSAGAPITGEFQVNSFTASTQSMAHVASAADGSFLVVWKSRVEPFGPIEEEIRGRRFDAFGSPLTGEFPLNTHTAGVQRNPKIDMAADGSSVVVWSDLDQHTPFASIYGQRLNSAGGLVGGNFLVRIAEGSAGPPGGVALAGNGSFVVVWTEQIGGGGPDPVDVYARRFDASGTPITDPFRMNASTPGAQQDPDIAASSDGCFTASWRGTEEVGFMTDVFARRFNSVGSGDGPEFVVNSFTTGFQETPLAIDANASGEHVLIWEDDAAQDGSDAGMFGQRMSLTQPCAVCPAAPLPGCLAGESAKLQIKDNDRNSSDKLKWQLSRGNAFAQGDLGDPVTTTDYTLCIYDERSGTPVLAGEFFIEANPAWQDSAPSGFKYKDATGLEDGTYKGQLKTGDEGRTKVSVSAKGINLPMPVPFSATKFFDQSPKVTVQLSNSATSTCWTSEFTTASRNEFGQFSAKAP